MARGTTLAVLRNMLKAEIGDFMGTNTSRDRELSILLSNKQKWLASEYDWPFLEHRWDLVVLPGQQFTTLPTLDTDEGEQSAINFERPVSVHALWSNVYSSVDFGINETEYNSMNFAFGQQSDPILKYRLASNASGDTDPNQIEVWPVPTVQQTLRFVGQRALATLEDDVDMADLDDMLLVSLVAAEKLQRSKQADAAMKLALAQQRMRQIRMTYPSRDQRIVLGDNAHDKLLVAYVSGRVK